MTASATPVDQTGLLGRVGRFLRGKEVEPLLYLAPTMIPLLVLNLYPFLRGVYFAFTEYDLYKKDTTFTGLSNFVELIVRDSLFWGAFRNNIVWTVGIVAIAYVIGFFTSLALNQKLPGRALFRGIALIPWVCPSVVAGYTWRWIYDPAFGLLNYVLVKMGVIEGYVSWLSDKQVALAACMLVAVWRFLPFAVVMLLAGLQAIPEELYEAAAIDGAGTVGKMRYVTLPLLNRVGAIAILLMTISAFNHFDSVYAMTQGGPGNRTMLLSIMSYLYAFRFYRIGFASAIGVIMLVVLAVPIFLYVRRVLQDVE
jgi:ABC-type sugar transport system permease subunit